MPTPIETAKALRDMLDASIAMHDAGDVIDADLRDAAKDIAESMRVVLTASEVAIKMPVVAMPLPSPDVLAAVGDSQEARAKFIAETQRKRAAAITLAIASELASLLLPVAGQLIRRGAGLVAILVLSLALAPACQAQIGPESEPLVQVGSEGQPLASVPVDANVAATVAASVEAPVDATLRVASPSATVTGSADLSGIGADTTTQSAHQANTSSAGGDNRPVDLNLNLDGSGWPIVVIVIGLSLMALFYTIHRRQAERQTATDTKYATTVGNAQGVARAIHELGPGPVRDQLLTLISRRVKDKDAWDAVVGSYDVSIGDRPKSVA